MDLFLNKKTAVWPSCIWRQKRGLLKEFNDMGLAKPKRPFRRQNLLTVPTISYSGISLTVVHKNIGIKQRATSCLIPLPFNHLLPHACHS